MNPQPVAELPFLCATWTYISCGKMTKGPMPTERFPELGETDMAISIFDALHSSLPRVIQPAALGNKMFRLC